MAYETLKSDIQSYVKQNGEGEITGDGLQSILLEIVNTLGTGFKYVGVATPSTSPGTPSENVFYIGGGGIYANFGSTIEVEAYQICVFAYNGSWSKSVINVGSSFDVEDDPAGASVEFTFYSAETPNGRSIKINKDVSDLSNEPDEAISQWWAAQKERKINLIAGYTIDFDSLDASSPSSLGVFKAIQAGQIIDSYTNATSLIFGTDGGQSVTINKSQLPYTAAANLINVKSASETLSNVSIKVRGSLENMPSYININEIANHPAAYANAAAALADVPEIYRRKNVKVVYFDDDMQLPIEMLCIDDYGIDWDDDWWTNMDNWAIEGPIRTEINEGGTSARQLDIAGDKRANMDDFLNVNVWNATIYPYETKEDARLAVPIRKRKVGLTITYLLDEGWITEQFTALLNWGTDSVWVDDDNWVAPVIISQNASTGKTTISVGEDSYDVATDPVSVSQNTSTDTDGNGTITIGDTDAGKYAGADKLLKITKWQTDWTGADETDIVYRSDQKLLRRKVNGSWTTIPYYIGAIYIYNADLYLWNGTDLVMANDANVKDIAKIKSKVKPYSFYFIGRNSLIVENGNSVPNGIFIKPSQDVQFNAYEAGNATAIYTASNWTTFATAISKSLVTSPNGLTNCIQINSSGFLVFDTINKVPVIRTRATLALTDIVLVSEAGGRCLYVDEGLLNIIDKEPLFDIVKTIQPYTCYFSGRNSLIVEETNNNADGLFFKPTDENAAFGLYGANDEQIINIASWAAFATALGKTFVTSPNGLTNCLQLTLSECLVLNTKSKALSIKSRSNLTATDVILLQVAGGRCLYVNQGLYNIIDLQGEIPYWWESYMKTKIATINEKCNTVGCDGDNFVFITDIHQEHNYGNSPSLIKYILNNTPIKNVVIGGDLLSDASSKADALTKIQALRNKYDFTPYVFPILGNHDIDITSSIAITFGEYYSIMLHPLENIMTLDKLPYYYKDNESQRIRYIYLDGSDTATAMSNTQKTWLQNRMSELQTGWTIVIFSHTYWAANVPPSVSTFGASLVSAINEIIGNIDATLAVVVTGHAHRAMATQDTNGYWIVATPCDAGYGEASAHDDVTPTRNARTTSEQVFDVFNINTNTKKIYITRIGGNGVDRELTYS